MNKWQAAGNGQTGQSNQDLASEQEGIRRNLESLRQKKYDREVESLAMLPTWTKPAGK